MLVYNLVCIRDPISFPIYRACANIKVKGHEVTRREHRKFSCNTIAMFCINLKCSKMVGYHLLQKHGSLTKHKESHKLDTVKTDTFAVCSNVFMLEIFNNHLTSTWAVYFLHCISLF